MEDRRRPTEFDMKIGHIEAEMTYLREAENKNANSIDKLATSVDQGFKEIFRNFHEFKSSTNKPNYVVVIATLSLLGAFGVTWSNYMISPMKESISELHHQAQPISSMATTLTSLSNRLDNLKVRVDNHTSDGHPQAVISRVDSLRDTIIAKFEAERDYTTVRMESINKDLKNIENTVKVK